MSAQEFLQTWTKAEREADTNQLATMLTDDFTGIGPSGFMLSKQDWLTRHGPLKYQRLELTDVKTRTYGEAVVAVGTQTQEATYNESPVPATLRTSIVLIRAEDTWKITNVHFSNLRST
jgi:hypothetical protein